MQELDAYALVRDPNLKCPTAVASDEIPANALL